MRGTGDAGDHLLGGLGEGEDRRANAPRFGLLRRAAQQSAVAQMHPVKKAQGNDSLIDWTYLRSKKVFDRSQRAAFGTGKTEKRRRCWP